MHILYHRVPQDFIHIMVYLLHNLPKKPATAYSGTWSSALTRPRTRPDAVREPQCSLTDYFYVTTVQKPDQIYLSERLMIAETSLSIRPIRSRDSFRDLFHRQPSPNVVSRSSDRYVCLHLPHFSQRLCVSGAGCPVKARYNLYHCLQWSARALLAQLSRWTECIAVLYFASFSLCCYQCSICTILISGM